MAEARAQREAVADGVTVGYAEAQVSAGVWRGTIRRFWRPAPPPPTPEQAEATFDRIAGMYPGALVN